MFVFFVIGVVIYLFSKNHEYINEIINKYVKMVTDIFNRRKARPYVKPKPWIGHKPTYVKYGDQIFLQTVSHLFPTLDVTEPCTDYVYAPCDEEYNTYQVSASIPRSTSKVDRRKGSSKWIIHSIGNTKKNGEIVKYGDTISLESKFKPGYFLTINSDNTIVIQQKLTDNVQWEIINRPNEPKITDQLKYQDHIQLSNNKTKEKLGVIDKICFGNHPRLDKIKINKAKNERRIIAKP